MRDTLYVHPTRIKCNKACSFCISKQQINVDDSYPEFLDFIPPTTLGPIISSTTIHKIEITGGGEPTLNPNLPYIISALKPANKTIKLYTNGILLVKLPKFVIDTITISRSINELGSNNIDDFECFAFYRNFCQNLRLRIYIDPYDFSKNTRISNLAKCIINDKADQIVLGLDFYLKYNDHARNMMNDIRDRFMTEFDVPIKIDFGDKVCPDYPLLYTDGLIHSDWRFILKPESYIKLKKDNNTTEKGYHLTKIKKEKFGSSAKILEEVQELLDSENQNSKIMTLLELSDIIGAVEGYLKEKFPDFTLDDLIKMKDITKRAFISGERT